MRSALAESGVTLSHIIYALQRSCSTIYPGPFAAKITDAYNGFYAFQRRLHLKARQN
ncbi:uncharacterized protein F4817DRAFT_350590 [Daldinia loculata]|uniref:uncharacterized protein n=1 Tax=Daldinia loculata TaxID=103429 RepID=UPI0020C3A24C|nr:uncharacterized protein F4817DRAFT_350590 [Daldinia loculata]KAI1643257.1 hypothetical protein F4817DRAFT_350590 [Daldinia loculata]